MPPTTRLPKLIHKRKSASPGSPLISFHQKFNDTSLQFGIPSMSDPYTRLDTMDFQTELPEGDIGQLLRGLGPRNRKARRENSVGGFAARVGGGGRIERRPAVPRRGSRTPTGPRNLSTPRTWSSRGLSRSSYFTPDAERRFDTDVYGMRAVDDMDSGLRRLENDPDSVVVAVHGLSRTLPRGGVKAGYGVFVSGLAHQLNRSGPVPYLAEQTADFAEIFAAMQALEVIHTLIFSGQNISHVVIKTNSEFLANSMIDLVWIWAGRNFENKRGQVCAVFR